MRITQFKGRPVIDRATARRIGVTVDALVDPTTARIVALEVGSLERDDRTYIPAEWITRVGSAAIMVMRRSDTASRKVDATRDRCLNYDSLIGLEVLDEDGERIGNVEDAVIGLERLTISTFEVARTGWHRRLNIRHAVRPNEVAAWSRELMLLREGRPAASSSGEPSTDGGFGVG